MAEFDLVVRGGSLVDGTGAAARPGDVAVRDGRIVEAGRVTGSRGAAREDATDDEISEMGRRIAIEQGALGFSTDRLAAHRTSVGDHTPAFGAAARECIGIALEAGKAGRGALNLVSDFDNLDDEFDMIESMVSGAPRVPYIVEQQCSRTARFLGLNDRGLLTPGYRADLNVIDFDNLRVRRPEVHFDLPAGGKRLMQRADGYLPAHRSASGGSTTRAGHRLSPWNKKRNRHAG